MHLSCNALLTCLQEDGPVGVALPVRGDDQECLVLSASLSAMSIS
jgi:hypothetical protein